MKLLDEKACINLVDAGSDEPYDENEPRVIHLLLD